MLHCACATWKISACSVGSQWHGAAGLVEVDAHLSDTDSGTARRNISAAPFSVPLAAPRRCSVNLL